MGKQWKQPENLFVFNDKNHANNICVESTLRDAMQLDYEVILVSDGTTATDDILRESTLANTYHFG